MIIVNSAGERASRGSGRRQVAKERFGPVGSRTPVRVTEAPFANPRPRSSTRFRARSACSVEQGTRVEEHRGSREIGRASCRERAENTVGGGNVEEESGAGWTATS